MDEKRKKIEEIKEDIRRWHREGFDLEPIYSALKEKDVKKFLQLYEKYKRLIPKMRRFQGILKNSEFEMMKEIRMALRNPELFESMESEIMDIIKKRDSEKESEESVIDLITGLSAERIKIGLNPSYTFKNYLVYEGNNLAYKAAQKIIESPGSINPLIIVGDTGTGKTHLLNAIGNEYLKRGRKVIYRNAEEILLNKEVDFSADVMIIDDFNILLENESIHPLLNLIMDSYTYEKKQLIVSSSMNLKYYVLEQSLRAKIEGGITVALNPPDEKTRVEILRIKVKEMNVDIEENIFQYLARNIGNLNTLVSSLKKLIAFSKIMGEKPTISMAAELIKGKISLQSGSSYLVEEEKIYRSISHLKELLRRGYKGIVITRSNPRRFKSVYDVSADIYWLTDHKTELPSISPILENINYFLERYIKGKTVILIDGVDFLISKNSPEAVIQFIRHLVDVISENKSILIVSLNPKTIEERYLKIMERELELA